MSIFTDIKDLAGGKKKSKDWYRSQAFYGLQDSTGFKVGDVIYYAYAAATEKLERKASFKLSRPDYNIS